MIKKDAAAVLKLWNKQQEPYLFKYKFSQEDVLHYLLPRPNLLATYVIEDMIDGKSEITDFYSMHVQSQQCLRHPKVNDQYQLLNVASMYYYSFQHNTWNEGVKQMMWSAKEDLNCDALTVMTVLDNKKDVMADMGFIEDSGCFHWYLVNWALGDKEITTNDIGCQLL